MFSELEERRNLIILFADISGFTRLASKLDPEDVQEVVNTCFEYLNKPITAQAGTIHKYQGDSVIAFFGFPEAHEDDPERAVKASLEMIELMPEINRILLRKLKSQTNIGLHVGVNMGTVVLGEIGSKEKKEYTIMGDAVNIASRLKDVAQMGEVIVSEKIFLMTRYLFDYRVLPPVSVKGIDKPMDIFRPLNIKDKPDKKRGIEGLYSPLVGRDEELNIIRDCLEHIGKGKTSVLFILGPAGIGKTRLQSEVKKLIVRLGLPIKVLESHCLSYGETTPYLPVLQIFSQIFKVSDSDSRETTREKIKTKVKEMFPQIFEEFLPYLYYLFSIPVRGELEEKIKHLDAQTLRKQIFMSLKKVFKTLGKNKQLCLFCEDYHWIDNESLQVLKFLFDSPQPRGLSFIGFSRIEKEKEPFKIKEELKRMLGSNYYEIHLKPLNADASSQLIVNLLSISDIPQNLKKRILSRAEGNPFYVEEIIRSLIDSHILKYSSGVWHINASPITGKKRDFPDIDIPDSIQGVIRARLDRLEPDMKKMLEYAAIIGRTFRSAILEQTYGKDHLIISLNLVVLEEYEYIEKTGNEPELEYAFRHPMLHEVTYNSILRKTRRNMHQKTAMVIEKMYGNRLDDVTELLAYQYGKSDNTEKAIEWLKKAAEKAKDRFANDEAIKLFSQILEITKENIEKNRSVACDCYGALGAIYALKGENTLALESYEAMLHNAGDDKIKASEARRGIAEVYEILGKWDDALKILEETEDVLSDKSVSEMLGKFEIYNLRSNIYKVKGELDKALKSCETALDILDDAALKDPRNVETRKIKKLRNLGVGSMASVHYTKGEFAKAIALWENLLKVSEELNDKRTSNSALNNLGVAYFSIGKLDKAVAMYQKGLKISQQIGDIQVIGRTTSNLGVAYYLSGDYTRAIELFQKYLAISEEIGDKRGTAITNGNLGISYYNLGNLKLAHQFFIKQLEISRVLGFRHGIVKATISLAHIYDDWGEYEEARQNCERSIEISAQMNNENMLGVAYFNLGNINKHEGNVGKAKEYFTQSENILIEAASKMEDRQELLNLYILLAELKFNLAVLSEDKKTEDMIKNALQYVDNALGIAEELDSRFSKGKCYVTYSKIFFILSDFKKAEKYFRAGVKILKELSQKKLLADSYFEYAKILKGKVKKPADIQQLADRYLIAAHKLYSEMNIPHKIAECSTIQN